MGDILSHVCHNDFLTGVACFMTTPQQDQNVNTMAHVFVRNTPIPQEQDKSTFALNSSRHWQSDQPHSCLCNHVVTMKSPTSSHATSHESKSPVKLHLPVIGPNLEQSWHSTHWILFHMFS